MLGKKRLDLLSPTKALVKYSYWVNKRPAKILLGEISFLLIVSAITVGVFFEPSTSNSGREWLIKNDKATTRQDAIEMAIADVEAARNTTGNERVVGARRYNVYLAFRSISGNVFTEENLKTMSEVEAIVTGHAAYPDYCLLNYDEDGQANGCINKLSIVDKVYQNGSMVPAWAEKLDYLSEDRYRFGYFFSKTYDPVKHMDAYARSIVYVGLPLEGYLNANDNTKEQGEKIIENYLIGVGEEIHKYLGTKSKPFSTKYMDTKNRFKGDLEVLWWSFGLQQNLFAKAARNDFMWAIFSVISVGIYMGLHTRSTFIAIIGMMEIVLTIMVAYFFYRVVFQITYFTTIHFLAAFLLLGIGADDVFVFVDAFKQSECYPESSSTVLKRLEYTSLRASKAVMITSLTTTVAFLATASSKIMPISTFGIYAALCIFLLYWVNVMIMPPALICWHNMTKSSSKCCCCKPAADPESLKDSAEKPKKVTEGRVKQLRIAEQYFQSYHSIFINKTKYFLIALFLCLLAVSIYFCTTLQPPDEEENYFPSHHMFTRYRDLMKPGDDSPFANSGADYVAAVQIVWGLVGMDNSNTDPYNPDKVGKAVYDSSFDMSSPEAQSHVYEVCQNAKVAECSAKGCAGGTLVRGGEAKCFIEDFKEWLVSKDEVFPLAQEDFLPKLREYTYLNSTLQKYRDQIGLFPLADGLSELRYIAFEFNSTFSPPRPQGYTQKVYQTWESFMESQNEGAPEGVNKGYQTTNFAWTWLETQKQLVKGVQFGTSLVIAIAFAIINVSTMNWIISVGAIIAIGGIVVTTMGLGVAFMMNYPLGVAESIATVILIGFSMDYCLHLAGAYMASKKATRVERMTESLTEMGISVTAGALTTIFSGVFLFGTVVTFFQKFAFIIVFTIAGSWLWSTLFFSAFCMVFGPEGDAGEWLHIFKSLRRRMGWEAEPEPEKKVDVL